MNIKRFILNTFLLIAATLSMAATASAQNDGQLLAAGDPPLSQSDFEGVVKYYERGLDLRFSAEERDEFRAKFVRSWRDNQKSNGKNLTDFMRTVKRLNSAVSDEKIRENQREFTDALLADLDAMARNGWSAFVVGLYRSAHPDEASSAARADDETAPRSDVERTDNETTTRPNGDAANFRPFEGVVRASDLAGKWVKGSVSASGYVNTVTNEYKGAYGAANQHDVYPNGSFDYTNYAQVSLYGCTTELFTSMKGRVSIAGAQVTFNYLSGSVKGKDSCKSTGFDKPAQIRQATYRVESDRGRLRLCEVKTETETTTCLYKEEK
jgi:hypothetical protein